MRAALLASTLAAITGVSLSDAIDAVAESPSPRKVKQEEKKQRRALRNAQMREFVKMREPGVSVQMAKYTFRVMWDQSQKLERQLAA